MQTWQGRSATAATIQTISTEECAASQGVTQNLHAYMPNMCVSTCKMQVLKYVSLACGSCLEMEPQSQQAAELQLLWKVLQLLCQHKGDLHSAITPGVSDKRPGRSCLPMGSLALSHARVPCEMLMVAHVLQSYQGSITLSPGANVCSHSLLFNASACVHFCAQTGWSVLNSIGSKCMYIVIYTKEQQQS